MSLQMVVLIAYVRKWNSQNVVKPVYNYDISFDIQFTI